MITFIRPSNIRCGLAPRKRTRSLIRFITSVYKTKFLCFSFLGIFIHQNNNYLVLPIQTSWWLLGKWLQMFSHNHSTFGGNIIHGIKNLKFNGSTSKTFQIPNYFTWSWKMEKLQYIKGMGPKFPGLWGKRLWRSSKLEMRRRVFLTHSNSWISERIQWESGEERNISNSVNKWWIGCKVHFIRAFKAWWGKWTWARTWVTKEPIWDKWEWEILAKWVVWTCLITTSLEAV